MRASALWRLFVIRNKASTTRDPRPHIIQALVFQTESVWFWQKAVIAVKIAVKIFIKSLDY